MNEQQPSDRLAELQKLASQRFGTLLPAEIKMLKAALEGEIAYCGPTANDDDPLNNPRSEVAWADDRQIRAGLLRWLCLEKDAEGAVDPRGIRIHGAAISGTLNISFASVRFPLRLNRCRLFSALVLSGASLAYFDLSGSRVPGIEADYLKVAGNVRLTNPFMSTGRIWLRGAQIEGNFTCSGGRIENPAQDGNSNGSMALVLSGAHVRGDIFLDDGFRAVGAVNLIGTQISGDLDCSSGNFTGLSADGSVGETAALNADRATISGSLFLSDGFKAQGGVWLSGTKIEGDLDCHGGGFDRLTAQNMSVGRSMYWREVTEPALVVLDLVDASVNSLVDDVASWPGKNRLFLDGFVYGRVSDGPRDYAERLKWLDRQQTFATQPYQQLARVLREEGDDRGARRVLYEMERLRRKDGKHGRMFQAWSQLFRWTIGYGLFPRRALWTLLCMVMLGWGLYRFGYYHNAMAPTNKDAYSDLHTGKPIPHYQHFYALVYSLENSFPLVNLSQKEFWTPDPNQETGLALGLRTFRWLQVISGWVLATFFAAGVTGIARKD